LGDDIPDAGRYSVGNVFLPRDEKQRAECKSTVEAFVKAQGQTLIGWRQIPTEPIKSNVGPTALASMPAFEQLIVGAADAISDQEFDRQLYLIRKQSSRVNRSSGASQAKMFYICTL